MPPCPLYLKDWTCHILLDISAQFSAFVRKRSPSLVAVLVMCQKIESFENSFCHFLSLNLMKCPNYIYDFQQIKKGVWTYFRDVPRSSLKKWDRDRSWNWLKNILHFRFRRTEFNLKFCNDFFVKPIWNKFNSGNGNGSELEIYLNSK